MHFTKPKKKLREVIVSYNCLCSNRHPLCNMKATFSNKSFLNEAKALENNSLAPRYPFFPFVDKSFFNLKFIIFSLLTLICFASPETSVKLRRKIAGNNHKEFHGGSIEGKKERIFLMPLLFLLSFLTVIHNLFKRNGKTEPWRCPIVKLFTPWLMCLIIIILPTDAFCLNRLDDFHFA